LVDCRPGFVDSGAPGTGCVYNFLGEQDGHHPRLRGCGAQSLVHRWLDHLDH
jgi:hypothetical protein